MDIVRMVALALIAAGVLGLIYGGFSYTRDSHEATMGPIHMSVTERERVNVPMWAGVGAIVVGGALLAAGGRRS